jgi:uncharacterized BrkB/YihY/UPF0761 family membrane protein
MDIGSLIGIVVSLVIGIALMPIVSGAVEDVIDDNDLGTSIESMLRILPIIVVTLLILGAVAYFAFVGKGG